MQQQANVISLEKSALIAIGDRLKKARENKTLTIDQVQKQTRIRANIIAAIEKGTCDEMLPQLYVKSYLKTYAGLLGVDIGELSSKDRPERPSAATITDKVFEPKRSLPEKPVEKLTPSLQPETIIALAKIAGVIIAAIIILTLTISLGRKIVTSLTKPRASKQVVATEPAVRKSAALKKVAPPVRKVQAPEPDASAKKAPAAATSKNMSFTLTLKVKKPVWVDVRKDGEDLFKRVLPKGTIETFNVNHNMQFYVASADSIEIFVDNKALKLPAKKGVIKNLEVTKKGIN